MHNVYLDGVYVAKEPTGLSEMREHLYFSRELSAFLLEVEGNLVFYGDQYNYIRELFKEELCGEMTIRIVDDKGDEFLGIIKVADAIFYPTEKAVEVEVQNNNITSVVENNKQIKCVLTAGKTKNSIPYTVTSQADIEIPNPPDTSSVTNRSGLRIWDALDSVIRFISDNQISLVSDYYNYNTNTGPQVFGVIMTGLSIRTGGTNKPSISFYELYTDLVKGENLQMAFEDGFLRIEPQEYFKQQQTSGILLDGVRGLTQILEEDLLYAKVKFGSAVDSDLSQTDYLPDIRFNGTREEEYHLGGQCNTDTELDLKFSALITDTNIIQGILPVAQGGTNSDAYDEDVFLLQLDENNKAEITLKPGSIVDYYFNERFTNRNIALRQFGSIPQGIYAFLGAGTDGCDINQEFNVAPLWPQGFQPMQNSPAPWNDANGNYAVALKWMPLSPMGDYDPTYVLFQYQSESGYYTAPFNGVFSFEYEIFMSNKREYFLQKMHDSANSGVGHYALSITEIAPGLWRVYGGASYYLNAGEYVGVVPLSGIYADEIYAGSTFRVSDPLGGQWQTYDAADVYGVVNSAKHPISYDDWQNIKSNPYRSIEMTYKDGRVTTWLKDISRQIISGESTEELISKTL